jgi:hypothetical protein
LLGLTFGPEDGGFVLFGNVGLSWNYTELQPRRPFASEAKLSLCLIKQHNMEIYEGVQILIQGLLISAIYGVICFTLRSFYPWDTALGTHKMERLFWPLSRSGRLHLRRTLHRSRREVRTHYIEEKWHSVAW